MSEPHPRRWLRAMLLLALMYLVIGLTFSALAGSSTSIGMRGTWRLLAWTISAAAFAVHLAYEHRSLRSAPAVAALHIALAVGLGACALAAAANIRAVASGSGHALSHALAILLWPMITALPAFVVAFASTAALSRGRTME